MRRCAFAVAVVLLLIPVGVRGLERALTFQPSHHRMAAPDGVTERWIMGAQGVRLHSWWFPARHAPAKATLLFNHGKGGDLTSALDRAATMTALGYDIVLWDYRGYGRSEGAVADDEAAFYADGDAVFDAAVGLGKPVVVVGHSLGTTVSADLCARRPCAALVMESGLSSSYHYAQTQVWFLPAWFHTFAKFQFDSAAKMARVAAPVLVVHGTADRSIAFSHGERLFRAARPDRRKFLAVPGAGHVLHGTAGYAEQIDGFLTAALARSRRSVPGFGSPVG